MSRRPPLSTSVRGDSLVATPSRHSDVYRYVPPEQVVAGAVTYIEDVLLEFALTFSGSLLVTCRDLDSTTTEDSTDLQAAGAALHRIADGLFISSVRADEPRIESASGHRFTHVRTSLTGSRTRRFTGHCSIEITGGSGVDEPAVSGSLDYVLDVTAAAPSDPPTRRRRTARGLPGGGVVGRRADGTDGTDCEDEGAQWSERYDRSLASIGAVVLAPVPVSDERAARLYAT